MLTLREAHELQDLERKLAYSAARSDVEVHCLWSGDAPGRWYDPESAHEDDRETVDTAIRYLTLRGAIEHHENGVWVRVRDE